MNFANEIFNTTAGEPIVAIFKNGSRAEYTTNIFNLLTSDPDTECIYDAETGEVIFER